MTEGALPPPSERTAVAPWPRPEAATVRSAAEVSRRAEDPDRARAPDASQAAGAGGASPRPGDTQDGGRPETPGRDDRRVDAAADERPAATVAKGRTDLQRASGAASAGSAAGGAAVGASSQAIPTTPEQSVATGSSTQVNARRHELAPWMDDAKAIIDDAWDDTTPIEAKAMGLQGTTIVRIEVNGNGKVVSKTLVRKSGYDELDAAALAAIPARLPAPPKGHADPLLRWDIEFRRTDAWASTDP